MMMPLRVIIELNFHQHDCGKVKFSSVIAFTLYILHVLTGTYCTYVVAGSECLVSDWRGASQSIVGRTCPHLPLILSGSLTSRKIRFLAALLPKHVEVGGVVGSDTGCLRKNAL